jgi:hypothetical protein
MAHDNRNTRTVTLLNPGGRSDNMAHRSLRNPPEGGYLKTALRMLGVTAVAAVGAGAASYLVARFAGTEGEGTQDLIIGLSGFGIGAALMLLGTPGMVRSSVGLGIAAGTGTLAVLRYSAYKLGGDQVAAALDAQRTAMAASYGSASGVYGAGGLPVGSNAYMGLGAGYPYSTIPAGAPVGDNAYRGWGTAAA